MLRKKAEPINNLLRIFLRENGMETPLNELRAVEAWQQIAPQSIQRYTTSAEVRNNVLYISISNPALRANMMMTRAQLIDRINGIVGAQAISNIVFR